MSFYCKFWRYSFEDDLPFFLEQFDSEKSENVEKEGDEDPSHHDVVQFLFLFPNRSRVNSAANVNADLLSSGQNFGHKLRHKGGWKKLIFEIKIKVSIL